MAFMLPFALVFAITSFWGWVRPQNATERRISMKPQVFAAALLGSLLVTPAIAEDIVAQCGESSGYSFYPRAGLIAMSSRRHRVG